MSVSVFWSLSHYTIWRSVTCASQHILVTMSVTLYGGKSPMSVSVFWSLCQSHCMEVSHICQSVYFGHYVSHIVWR